jgi:hypothetical protein
MKLQEILYQIKVMSDVNYLKDLYKDEFVRDIITHVNKHSKCKRSLLIDLLEQYVLEFYVYEESEYISERFLNDIRKYLGRRGQQM